MRESRTAGFLRSFVYFCFVNGCLLALTAAPALATGQEKPDAQTVQALLVSDIHFEPFWDPDKAAQLAAAPVAEWNAILGSPASADQPRRFAALQQTCHAKGMDAAYPLYDSSLRAMRAQTAGARFIIVSGDLIAHDFSCKYATLFPKAAANDYSLFVEKTIDYVMSELRGAFPGVPVYAALGNNDSGCHDYQLDANSGFLEGTGRSLAADVPATKRKEALRAFAAGGYYSVALPAPIEHTRLLVLDDLFMSKKYQTCSGKDDPAPAAAQIAWLEQQLNEARRKNEKVWVTAHIPPGVDPYSTVTKGKDVCKGGKPTMFLSSEALPEAMAGYGDVIQLAIFAHTHMDEVRLLRPTKADPTRSGVAIKMVASISPKDGNNPSFTVGQIDAATATLKDYRVIAASNKTGIDTAWTEEYDFAETYKEPAFSAATLGSLIAGFQADSGAQAGASQSYIRSYGTGAGTRELRAFWPQYVCALTNDSADAYRACVCK